MAVPGSGPISLFYIVREVNSVNRATLFNGSAVNSENFDYDDTIDPNNWTPEAYPPYTPDRISLTDASDGTVDTIDQNNHWTNRPDTLSPHKMSEFYNYNHNQTSGGGDEN